MTTPTSPPPAASPTSILPPGFAYWKSDNSRAGKHLRIVISGPDGDGAVLVVNVTDLDGWPDCSCVLKKGEHPRITKDSVINYDDARLLPLGAQKMAQGDASKLAPLFPKHLVERIQKGALASDDLADRYKDLLRLQGVGAPTLVPPAPTAAPQPPKSSDKPG